MSDPEQPKQNEKAVTIDPKGESIYIIQKSDLEKLTDEADKVARGNELHAGGIGFLFGILVTILIFAFYLNAACNKGYFYSMFLALVLLICLFISLSWRRKEQGDSIKQWLKKIVPMKEKTSQEPLK